MLMVMDPLQQTPTPPNPYGFIVNPEQPAKRPFLGGNSTKSRLILVMSIVVILLIIGFVVTGILSSMNNKGTNQLKAVYAEQQELIRIAQFGAKDARSSDTRNFAITTLFTAQTSQQEINTILTKRGVKLKPEEVNAKLNTKIEEVLTGASANNRYDQTMQDLLEKQIGSYNQSLQSAFNSNDGKQTKAALSQAFKGSATLVRSTETTN